MAKPRGLGDQIKKLHNEGLNYTEIINILHCSSGTIGYYLCKGQKERSIKRSKINKQKRHPYISKIGDFCREKKSNFKYKNTDSINRLLYGKLKTFTSKYENNKKVYMTPEFTVEDVINKFGEKPKCYLTGVEIDIYQPRTYNFDHKIPRSKQGENTLDNLGLATKKANLAKSDMTPDEFFAFCKQVLEHQGYDVTKK